MNRMPSREAVERLRNRYPAGTRVELVSMDDPYSTLKPGDRGSIDFFDDTGTAFVTWDNGSSLGLVYGADQFKAVADAPRYEDGAHFWRDTAANHGLAEALVIGGNYLAMQLRQEIPDDERRFCRELFAAMHEASAGKADPAKIVYPYPLKEANDRGKKGHYRSGAMLNAECAAAIDAAISASCYKTNFYNLDIAAMGVIHAHGFERVNAVLAHAIRHSHNDGRYSGANKTWAGEFELPDAAFGDAYLRSHPILIDGFAKHARELYAELGAERFALPGREESGAVVAGYEITRSIRFDDRRGFAIGHDPGAPDTYVCWQFTTENGKREFYWGTYGDEKAAEDNYRARIIEHMGGGNVKEIPNPIAPAEMSAEQNLNMIDGVRNNGKNRLDLTDGQTHEEIQALAPETAPAERPSTLARIRAAKTAPKPPRKAKGPGQRKNQNDIEH